MADANTQYQGYAETFDINALKRALYWNLARTPTDEEADSYINQNPDLQEIVNKTIQFNQDSIATVDAVKVAYTGTTDTERIAWLNARLKAVDSRAAFIKERYDTINERLKEDGEVSAGDVFLSVWQVAFSAINPIGGLISGLFAGKIAGDKAARIARNKALLQAYIVDIQQLATIRDRLVKELAGTDPINKAPSAVSMWWYIAGVALLILIVVWIRRRNLKRRKR